MWRIAVGVHGRGFNAGAEEDAVEFRERNAPAHARAVRFVLHVGNVEFLEVDAAVVDFVGAAHAFGRHVGFNHGERVGALRLRRIHVDRHRIAGTEDVVLREARRKNDAFRSGVAGAKRDRARRTFLHVHLKVDLIAGARNGLGFGRNGLKVAETVDAVARKLHLVAVEPGGFVLTHFAADHFVARAVVARDVDAADVGAAARVDRVDDVDRALFRVRNRIGIGARKCVAERGELVRNRGRHVLHGLSVVDVAFLQGHERIQLIIEPEHVALELRRADRVLFAFGEVDRDVDVGLIGGNRNLDRIDPEVEVALIHVEGADRLQVCRELLA